MRYYPTNRVKVVLSKTRNPFHALRYTLTRWKFRFYGDNGYSTLKYLLLIEIPFLALNFEVYRSAPKCGIRNTA
jgi:hypothetical protein